MSRAGKLQSNTMWCQGQPNECLRICLYLWLRPNQEIWMAQQSIKNCGLVVNVVYLCLIFHLIFKTGAMQDRQVSAKNGLKQTILRYRPPAFACSDKTAPSQAWHWIIFHSRQNYCSTALLGKLPKAGSSSFSRLSSTINRQSRIPPPHTRYYHPISWL